MSQSLRWTSPHPPTEAALTPGGRNEKLKAERVEYLLAALTGWQAGPERKTLVRRIEFDSHAMAASFVQWVFSLSERRSQFPVIRMERGTVELTLGTPGADGLTSAISRSPGRSAWAARRGNRREAVGASPRLPPPGRRFCRAKQPESTPKPP